MAKKTTTADPNTPLVSASFDTGLLSIAVTLNGEPIDADIQLWPNTAFRPTIGGELHYQYRDPRNFALSGARYERRDNFSISARVIVDDQEYLSDTVEVSID